MAAKCIHSRPEVRLIAQPPLFIRTMKLIIRNNYYANSTADIMYLNSPITGAVNWYPHQNIQIKHEYLHYCAYKIHIFGQF